MIKYIKTFNPKTINGRQRLIVFTIFTICVGVFAQCLMEALSLEHKWFSEYFWTQKLIVLSVGLFYSLMADFMLGFMRKSPLDKWLDKKGW